MNRLRPSDWIWIGIGVGVPLYNVFFAADGDTLSEAWDRYLKRWPWLRPVIHTFARHLANDLDPRMDPIGLSFFAARALLNRRRRLIVVVETEPA
jgi:hypothetical protein